MKVKDLIEDIENPIPTNIKDRMTIKLRELFEIVERYENSSEIQKSEIDKISTFKHYLKGMEQHNERV